MKLWSAMGMAMNRAEIECTASKGKMDQVGLNWDGAVEVGYKREKWKK